ncbi:hypothetical protein [Pelosinus sp. sgz500959]|uniref:hypothetical protein n=1 Tax=Pelosinus sp. sgz500959 TaxID=3242472 RepID=UPI00366F4B58
MAVPILEEVIARIGNLLPGTIIPKPRANNHRILRWGERNGEDALIYSIPKKKTAPVKNNEKGITVTEWQTAYNQLITSQEITREWFNTDTIMERCRNEGDCNFTTIGGIFVLIGLATRIRTGSYSLIEN